MRSRTLLAAILCIAIAGCSILSRSKSQFFTLESLPASQTVAIAGAPVAIEAIELPPGLDRRGIVVKKTRHELEIRETDQWTDTLETMVLHTFAQNLSERLPPGMVVLPGQPQPSGAIRSFSIFFDELTPGPEPLFILDAQWGSTTALRHERIEVPMSSLDSGEVASAMSTALAELADRMVSSLQ